MKLLNTNKRAFVSNLKSETSEGKKDSVPNYLGLCVWSQEAPKTLIQYLTTLYLRPVWCRTEEFASKGQPQTAIRAVSQLSGNF